MKLKTISLATILAAAFGLEGCISNSFKETAPRDCIIISGDTTKIYISSYSDELMGFMMAYPESIEIYGQKKVFMTQKSFMFQDGSTINVNGMTQEEIRREERNWKNILHVQNKKLENRKAYK